MVMVVGFARALEILLEGRKSLLSAREVAGLQRALQRLKVLAELARRVGLRLTVTVGVLGRAGHILLQRRKSRLGTGEVARLQGALQRLKVLAALPEATLLGSDLVRIRVCVNT